MGRRRRTIEALSVAALLAITLVVGYLLMGSRGEQTGSGAFASSAACVPLGRGESLCVAPDRSVLIERRAVGRRGAATLDGDPLAP